jgi:outer membrane protein assembly factor BamD (BamD/ComL family)
MKRLHGGLLMAVVMVAFVAACATMQSSWDATKSADTIAAYEDFLKKHPDGDLAEQARVRRYELYEERDWKDAEASNTIAVYEGFMKNYPQGRYKNDVSARLELLSLPNVSTEKLIKRYQQGVFVDETRSTLEKFSFEQAITGNTISAYEDYLKRYPVGMLADDARRRIEKLSFEQAQAEDTISAYGRHLNRYPHGVFADEARSKGEKLIAISSSVSEWGTIMYPRSNANIRANRSTASKLKGRLKTGQPVKVDFLQDAWYAVFPMTQKQRDEKTALGYVYAPLLVEKREPDPSGSTASDAKSAKDTPLKKTETDNLSVDVKNITFKVAGNGKELLLIEFDRFYTPAIFGIEGKEPLIILEMNNISLLREEWAAINTGGNFIRQIRTSMDSQTRSALIVLNMAPEKDYFVSQTFYQKENMYSLEISEKNETRLP